MPLRQPKVRSDLEYHDQEVDGEAVVTVHDPVRGMYYRYNTLQGAMLRSLDGIRTVDEMVEQLSEQFEVEIPRSAAERFIENSRERMLLDVASYNVADADAQREVLKALKKQGFRFRGLGGKTNEPQARVVSAEAVLFMGGIRQLQAGHPARALDYFCAVLELNPSNKRARTLVDTIQEAYVKALGGTTTDFPTFWKFNPTSLLRTLDRTIGRVIFHWVGWLLLAALVLFTIYSYSITGDVEHDIDGFDIIAFYLIHLSHAFVHEVGHGLACFHYGGKVTEIGFMRFMFLLPNPYCDTSSSYLFKSQREKIMVQLAGPIASLLFTCMTLILLSVLQPDMVLYDALFLSLLASGLTFFTNMMPLLKFDGYYALCDLTKTPNLRDRSFKALKGLFATRLFGVQNEELTAGHPRYLYAFAAGCVAFTLFWVYQVVFRLSSPLVEHLQGTGLVLCVVGFGYLLRRVFFWPIRDFLQFVMRERRAILRPRALIRLVVVAAIVVAPWAIPWPVSVDADFVLVPAQRSVVRAEVGGTVERLLVEEGERVRQGQPIASLRNPDLVRALRVTEAELEQLDIQLAKLRTGVREEELVLARMQVRTALVTQLRDAQQAKQAQTLAAAGAVAGTNADTREGEAAVSRGTANAARWRLATLEAGTREEVIAAAEAVRTRLTAQLEHVRSDLARLVVRSPIDGVITTKRLAEHRFSQVGRGDVIAEVHDTSSFVAEIEVPGSAPLEEFAVGNTISLRLAGAPDVEIDSRIQRIRDSAETETQDDTRRMRGLVVITEPFTTPDGRSGMGGNARLYGEERSLAYGKLYVPVQRLVRISLWALL